MLGKEGAGGWLLLCLLGADKVKVPCLAYWPISLDEGMYVCIAGFFLLIFVVDNKAETLIVKEPNSAPVARDLVNLRVD
ncbi:hypothetical protein ES703_119373 [subsurface metagenome]